MKTTLTKSFQSHWDVAQYEKFKQERSLPFLDLLALIQKKGPKRMLDLGCGSGELTKIAHETLAAKQTIGIDSSDSMLEKSKSFESDSLNFMQGDIALLNLEQPFGINLEGNFDLIISNAALQWLPEHEQIFSFLKKLLSPGGEIAIQIASNHDHPSHQIAFAMAEKSPFKENLNGYRPPQSVLPPEDYARLLHHLGFQQQCVRQQVYPHLLSSREEIVEWTKGTWLSAYQTRLPSALYDLLLKRYREILFAELPNDKPFFYPFKRTFIWGKL